MEQLGIDQREKLNKYLADNGNLTNGFKVKDILESADHHIWSQKWLDEPLVEWLDEPLEYFDPQGTIMLHYLLTALNKSPNTKRETETYEVLAVTELNLLKTSYAAIQQFLADERNNVTKAEFDLLQP